MAKKTPAARVVPKISQGVQGTEETEDNECKAYSGPQNNTAQTSITDKIRRNLFMGRTFLS